MAGSAHCVVEEFETVETFLKERLMSWLWDAWFPNWIIAFYSLVTVWVMWMQQREIKRLDP